MTIRKLKSKVFSRSLVIAAALVSSHAFAGGEVDALFGAIDFTKIAASVGALGVLIVGINMVFKGIDLAKRAVRKA